MHRDHSYHDVKSCKQKDLKLRWDYARYSLEEAQLGKFLTWNSTYNKISQSQWIFVVWDQTWENLHVSSLPCVCPVPHIENVAHLWWRAHSAPHSSLLLSTPLRRVTSSAKLASVTPTVKEDADKATVDLSSAKFRNKATTGILIFMAWLQGFAARQEHVNVSAHAWLICTDPQPEFVSTDRSISRNLGKILARID